MQLNLRYDMNSPGFGTPHPLMYRTAIEQAAWADKLGFTQVFLAEHHGESAEELIRSLVAAADTFTGDAEQFDDLTAMAIKAV